jgi:Amt family ammonium transporter
VALAAIICVGPRLGRFTEKGVTPFERQSHSKVFTVVGGLLLLIGWLGFNGGSGLQFDSNVSKIIGNTLVAGLVGAGLYVAIGYTKDVIFGAEHPVMGLVAGLVAVTAGAHAVDMTGAALLGAIGAIICYFTSELMLKCRLDDVVSAVACHGAAGVWGTVGVALAAPVEALPTGSLLSQMGVQAAGAAIVFVWAFGLSMLWFKGLNLVLPIRVPEDSERMGLNASEHKERMGSQSIAEALVPMIASGGGFDRRVKVEPGDESEVLAEMFNKLLDQLQAQEVAREMEAKEQLRDQAFRRYDAQQQAMQERLQREEELQITAEISRLISQATAGDLQSRISVTDKSDILSEISSGVNGLIDSLSNQIGQIAHSADDINKACDVLSDSSERLHSRSAAQIDSVQDVTFRLSSMADSAQNNVDAADEAQDIARETTQVATDVAQGIQSIETAIREIEASAKNIAPVVRMINDIASQTSLLAINASVEASRAGDAGKGFSVVAQEVRNLAASTQSFAKEIGEMVTEALGAVDRGVKVVDGTSTEISRIHAAAASVADQINNLHTVSGDQREKLRMLYESVMSISETSTENSRLAESTAIASENLRRKGADLLSGIASFSGYAQVAKAQEDDVDLPPEEEASPRQQLEFF